MGKSTQLNLKRERDSNLCSTIKDVVRFTFVRTQTNISYIDKMSLVVGVGDYTQGGTVDLGGNLVLRSKRSRWTACSSLCLSALHMNGKFVFMG